MPAVLTLDVSRLLDESDMGRAAAAALQRRYDALAKERAALPVDQHAAFEARALHELERERARLREEVLAAARPHVERLRQARGADVVLPASAVLGAAPETDITAEVLTALGAC